jgi:hypothetical protein
MVLRGDGDMKYKITNTKVDDYFIVFGDNLHVIKDVAESGMRERGWNMEDCYSEEI